MEAKIDQEKERLLGMIRKKDAKKKVKIEETKGGTMAGSGDDVSAKDSALGRSDDGTHDPIFAEFHQ